MRSNCTTKKKKRLVQVEWKWCGGLSRNNFKHKLYTTCNFGRKHHSFLCSILYASSWRLHPYVIFPQDFQVGVPKLGLLLSQNFGHSYLYQIKSFLRVQRNYFIALENIFPMAYSTFQLNLI
jgi:hypothetical protein